MGLIFELDGKAVHIVQNEFSLDFIAEHGGFNAIPINNDPVTVYKGDYDDPMDGLTLLNKLISVNGLTPMPCKLTHTDPNIGVLKQGRYDTRKNEYTCTTANIYVISEFEDFADRAEGLNLRKLVELGEIKAEDYQKVGYVLGMEEREMIGLLFSMVANFLNLLALVNQVRDEATAVPPNPWIIVLMAAELVAGILVQRQLIKEFIRLKPRKLTYYCIPVKTLIKKACKYLGYEFESNLLDNTDFNNMVLLGETEHEGVKGNRTPKNNPVPDMNLIDLLSGIGAMLKSKTKILNGKISLEEEKEFYANPSEFIIPRMQDDQTNPLTATHNVGDIPLSYGVGFSTDSSDRSTTNKNFGNKTIAHYSVAQFLQTRKSDFSAPHAVNEIPFARAKRRDSLTGTEKTYNSVVKAIFAPLRLLGFGLKDLLIDNEIEKCFELETHGINVPKILITGNDGFVSKTNGDVIDAQNLYESYHRQYTMAGGRDGLAYWTNYEGSMENGLCQDSQPDFLLSKLNSTLVAKTKEGNTAVITMHKYNDATNSHDFKYRVRGWQNILGGQFSDIITPYVTEHFTIDSK